VIAIGIGVIEGPAPFVEPSDFNFFQDQGPKI